MTTQLEAIIDFMEGLLERVNALEARLIASDILVTSIIDRAPDRAGLLDQASKVLEMSFDERSDPAIRQAAFDRLDQVLAIYRAAD